MRLPMVLMLGADIGFMFALAAELARRSILSCPARTVRRAKSMIVRFGLAPDVLIIDCGIKGACSLAETVAQGLRKVEIVGVVSSRNRCEDCAQRLGTILHQDDLAVDRISTCADLVEQLLRKQLHHNGHASPT